LNELSDVIQEIFEKKKEDEKIIGTVLKFLNDNNEAEIIPIIDLISYMINKQNKSLTKSI
jgi:predicted CopG family antitoxin